MNMIVLSILIFSVVGAASQNTTRAASQAKSSWKVEEFPNPKNDLDLCGRGGKKSWVCDPSNILTNNEANEIDISISRVCKESKCSCPNGCQDSCQGYTMAVAMVNRFYIPPGSNAGEQARKWALKLRTSQWDFDEGCGNDVIIVVSKADKKIYTSTGHRTIMRLRNKCVQNVFRQVKDWIGGDYFHGLQTMIGEYKQAIVEGGCGNSPDTQALNSKGKQIEEKNLSTEAIIGITIGCLIGGIILLCLCLLCCFKPHSKESKSSGDPPPKYTPYTTTGGYSGKGTTTYSSRGGSKGYSGGGGSHSTTYVGGAVIISDHDHCSGDTVGWGAGSTDHSTGGGAGGGGGGGDYSSGGGGGGTVGSGGGGGGTVSSGGGGGGCGSDCGGGGGCGSDCGGD